ncbi:MAG: hypothetical protein M9892_03185 [Bacteroidetes bacterium]|nr:hypothetical protein [Bacteroidota bacterium]
MRLETFIAGETLALVLTLADAGGEPIAWEELDELTVVLSINRKPVAVLRKSTEELEPGEEEGEVLLVVEDEATAVWQSGKLTATVSVEIGASSASATKIEVVELFNVRRENVG